jgi:hypothetical protein
MQVMMSDNKAHAGYLLFPKAHELMYPQCVPSSVFTKNFSDHKPTGPVNHQNPQAQILFCWPEKND